MRATRAVRHRGCTALGGRDLEQLVHLGLVEDAVCVAVALADEAQHFNVALYVIVIALEQSMHVFFRDHSVAIFVNLRPGPPEDL